MEVELLPPALLCVVGLAALASGKSSRVAHGIGALGAAAACVVGLAITVRDLVAGSVRVLSVPWNTTLGASFAVGFDPLTGVFLLPLYLLGALCAVFGWGYLSHADTDSRRPSHWLFYCFLVASMALVMMARNAVLFLVVWETMSLSSWVLVTFEHDDPSVRRAGVTYLVATQIGTAFLIVLFLLLGAESNPVVVSGETVAALDFSRFGGLAAPAAGVAFLLALVGFGTKAGIVPLHVWLPEAHPAAPSHVSALMSGVMIKTGIYGLLRTLTLIGPPPAWWGWTLVAVGAFSAVIGVLFAIAQRDIKRLLAYSSVENIGIICLGIGVGLLGLSYGAPLVGVLGFAGAVLHVLNHALFKGLLFLGSGALTAATGTRAIDRWGGLLRRMPATGTAFLVASLAICGLPPLNGFVSEALILFGAFRAVTNPLASPALGGAFAIVTLGLVSGLAVACFVKLFGVAFLGEPRTEAAAGAAEPGASFAVPMLVLAGLCVAAGFLSAPVLRWIAPLAGSFGTIAADSARAFVDPVSGSVWRMAAVMGGVAALTAALALIRFLLLRRRTMVRTLTWDCGYVKPTARMQYTASSFTLPLVEMFRGLLAPRRRMAKLISPFPKETGFSSETPDAFSQRLFGPAFRGFTSLLSRLRWLQHGRLQLYVLYIAITLGILFIWRFV